MKAQINEIKRMQQLAGILKEYEDTEQLDEGVKDTLLGALMSLSFLTPAKAQQAANSIANAVPPSKISAIVQDIKSADNTTDLSSIVKSYSEDTENIETIKNIPKPSGYKPLSIQQREDWNKYLNYLGDKAGSPELDKGSPTKGRQELDAYLKANPNSSLNDFSSQDDLVKSIQYEMHLIRRGEEFPGITPSELGVLQKFLLKTRKPFMMVRRSEMDGNPGQFTTQEYYPGIGSAGTDYKKAMKSIYTTLKTIK